MIRKIINKLDRCLNVLSGDEDNQDMVAIMYLELRKLEEEIERIKILISKSNTI